MISLKKVITVTMLMIVVMFILFPLIWMFTTSIKPESEAFSKNPTWLPQNPTLQAYFWAWDQIGEYAINTLIVSIGSAIGTVGLTILTSYSLARYKFSGKKAVSIAYIMSMMFPKILVGIPTYLIFVRLQLIDTYLSLIIMYIASSIPMAVWLLRSFFMNLPVEIEEAAMVDGCSPAGAFLRVVLPLSIPGIAAAGLFSFIGSWNDVLFALILTVRNRTISVKMLDYLTLYAHINWPGFMAVSMISALPPIIIFAFLQKRFVTGMATGAVKG